VRVSGGRQRGVRQAGSRSCEGGRCKVRCSVGNGVRGGRAARSVRQKHAKSSSDVPCSVRGVNHETAQHRKTRHAVGRASRLAELARRARTAGAAGAAGGSGMPGA